MCPTENRFKVVEKRPIREILNVELHIHRHAFLLEKIGADDLQIVSVDERKIR